MATRDEKTWSALAHVSIFFNLLVPFMGLVAALVIWVAFVSRSSRVSFHASQALWYQVVWLLLIFGALSLVGSFAAMVVAAISLLLPIKAAFAVNQGTDYHYPILTYLFRYSQRAL